MKLSKPLKILVGIGTLWNVLYPFMFLAFTMLMMFGTLSFARNLDERELPFFMIPFFAIFPLHCLTILLSFALMVFYIIHLVKNKDGAETTRILLGLGFFFLPMISMPVYYITYIWPDTPPAWAIEKPAPISSPEPAGESKEG